MRFHRTSNGGWKLPVSLRASFFVIAAVSLTMGASLSQAWALPAATTTLAVTSGGSAVTTVATGKVVTLTATVKSGGAFVWPGQVNFCDAAAKYCTDIHLLGTAQLTKAGKATLKFIPGPGSHEYKAVFAGTKSEESSASAPLALTVTASKGQKKTIATIAASAGPDTYSLTATLSGNGEVPPSGTVSFLDTSDANSVLGTAELLPGDAALNFANLSVPGTGGPTYVVTADFNGDGIPDLALTNYVGYSLTILLGNGDGTFKVLPYTAAPTNFLLNASIAVGDFNGDGIPDLIVGDDEIYSATVLLGKGDGTFTQGETIQTGDFGASVAVADFNGDGKLDLAITNDYFNGGVTNNNTVSILLGNGDGSFQAEENLPTGKQPLSVVVGDFNGDGKLDLAVANFLSNDVTILLGYGDGTFTNAPSVATGSGPSSIAVGDFNGDGKTDLAVANSKSNTVSVRMGNGDGTFTAAASPKTGVNPDSIAVGDFNGDSKPDLAVTNSTSNTVTILTGNGNGTFTVSASPATGASPVSIAIGDFNGDGKQDLAVANEDSTMVTVLLGQDKLSTAKITGIAPLALGTHLAEVSYEGDGNYSGSVSATTALTVLPPSFTLSGTAITIAAPGASGTSTLSITPGNRFTGQVALSCVVARSSLALPGEDTPTCSVKMPPAISGTAPVAATVTFATKAATSVGTYQVTVTGVSGAVTASTNIRLIVGTPTGFSLSATPVTPIEPGDNATSTITITPKGGFGGSLGGGYFDIFCIVTGMGDYNQTTGPFCSVTIPALSPGTTPKTATLTITSTPGIVPGMYTATLSAQATGRGGKSTFSDSLTVPLSVPVTVDALGVKPSFAMTGSFVPTIVVGGSATAPLTITPSGGFTGNVTLSCTVTEYEGGSVGVPTCSLPSSIKVAGKAPVTETVTVHTQPNSTIGQYYITVTANSGSIEATTFLGGDVTNAQGSD